MYHHFVTSKPLPYELPFIGEVEKIFSTYGFVATNDGQRYFFHFGTCASKPEALKVGDVVEFVLGEDVKTRRIHAQKVRKINNQDLAPSPSPNAAAILNSLTPINFLVSAQTLLTVTATNFLPMSFQNASAVPAAAAAAARLALGNSLMGNLPCGAVSVSPPAAIAPPPMQKIIEQENAVIKRPPLRQIMPQQPKVQPAENYQREIPQKLDHPPEWNAVLFPSFPSQQLPNDKEGINLPAFERARNAWYSVSDH